MAKQGGVMKRRQALKIAGWGVLATSFAAQNIAHAEGQASSFAIVGHQIAVEQAMTARPGSIMLELDARPILSISLEENIPESESILFGAKKDHPFNAGMQLYGWPEYPGLYCDVLRQRGLGISAACLRDTNSDGKFDEGLRLDFNNMGSDILVVSHAAKIIGARFPKTTVPLAKPVSYVTTPPTDKVTGKLALRWDVFRDGPERKLIQIWVSTPKNYTVTGGMSEKMLIVDRTKAPLDVEIYGLKVHIIGFDESGSMKFALLNMNDGASVPLIFRGNPSEVFFM